MASLLSVGGVSVVAAVVASGTHSAAQGGTTRAISKQAAASAVGGVAALAATVTYGQGAIQLLPATSAGFRVSADAAVSAFSATGLYEAETKSVAPTEYPALYTDHGEASTDPNAASDALKYSARPVWAVTYHGIPDMSAGAGGILSGTAGTASQDATAGPAKPEIHDLVAFVDASTGQVLTVISSAPDARAMAFSPGDDKAKFAAPQ